MCPNLLNPGNGRVVQANGGNVPGTVATYSCNAGYRLLGNGDRPCGSTGVWTGEAPTCQSKALQWHVHFKLIPNGCLYAWMQHEYYWVVHLIQHLSHTLRAGIVCPNLPNPGNGRVVQASGGNVPGTVATYSCYAGYRLLGNADRPCGSTGVWTGEVPTCWSKPLNWYSVQVHLSRNTILTPAISSLDIIL